MSIKNKVYYWFKLKEDFFYSKELKIIRKMPSGAEIIIVLLKMQLLSLAKGGIIEIDNLCDTVEEELSILIDEDEKIIKLALITLNKFSLIYGIDGKDIQMLMHEDLVGKETDSTIRSRKSRALKNEEKNIGCCNATQVQHLCNTENNFVVAEEFFLLKPNEIKGKNDDCCNATPMQQFCSTEIDIDIELDIELEKEKEIENHDSDFDFNKFFKKLGIKFHNANQEAVRRLLKEMSVKEVVDYLNELNETIKSSSSSVTNFDGLFTAKLQKGERQVNAKHPMRISEQKLDQSEPKKITSKSIIDFEAKEKQFQEIEIAEKTFNSLSENDRNKILEILRKDYLLIMPNLKNINLSTHIPFKMWVKSRLYNFLKTNKLIRE